MIRYQKNSGPFTITYKEQKLSSNKSDQPSYCGLLEPAQGPLEVIVCPRASLRSVVRCSVEVSIRTVANFYGEESLTCQRCLHRKICISAVSRLKDIKHQQDRPMPESSVTHSA